MEKLTTTKITMLILVLENLSSTFTSLSSTIQIEIDYLKCISEDINMNLRMDSVKLLDVISHLNTVEVLYNECMLYQLTTSCIQTNFQLINNDKLTNIFNVLDYEQGSQKIFNYVNTLRVFFIRRYTTESLIRKDCSCGNI